MARSKLFPLAALLAILAVAPALAKPIAMNTPKAALAKAYAGMDSALDRKDPAGFFAYYASNFVCVAKGKTQPLKTVRPATQQLLAQCLSVHAVSTLASIHPQGRQAVAISHTVVSFVLPDPKTHKMGTLVQDMTNQDTWANQSGSWKLVQQKPLSMTLTENGKPLK